MASPSASSATLSIYSGSFHIDADGDPSASYIAPYDDEEFGPPSPRWVDEVCGVKYYGEEDFVLGDEYLSPAPRHMLSPSMRAALHPDDRVLQKVLRDGNDMYKDRISDDLSRRLYLNGVPMSLVPDQGIEEASQLADMASEFSPNSLRTNIHAGITTPLLEAINYNLPQNVKVLLEAGANPNGVPLSVLESYATFFLRFRPQIPLQGSKIEDLATRNSFLGLMDLPQISKLTWEEVEDRLVDGMAPFWCEEAFTPKAFYQSGRSIPSLVAAAGSGNTRMFDQLLDAGADASFWLQPQPHVPDPPTASSLSVSSPLHAAIEIGNLTMVQHLLSLNFNPNILPLACPTRCYTPLTALVISPHFAKSIFETLISHPSINPSIRTPVYQVHILHFVVARLNLDILRYITSNPKLQLHAAGVTALGHTLLHIACMPATALHVQRRSELIYRSIHETRDLSSYNDPYTRYPPEHDPPLSEFETHFMFQTSIVKHLWHSGIKDVDKQDVHGNTALHYLAGCQSMNWALLEWLCQVDGSLEMVWRECKNSVGATPEKLAYAAEKCRDEGKSGWCDWFERHNSRKRVERKEDVWKGLLGGIKDK